MESAIDDETRETLPARLPKGFEIGGCVVDGWLRDGGMAAIYRGRRTLDERRVAIKLQLPSTAGDPEICARFDREAEVMARANGSPHVVELYQAGTLGDGRRYFALEWVEGENLEELLDYLRNQDQRMSIVRACRIGRDVAQGLAELHEHGVLHLDLKPANVMIVARDDGGDDVKLVDFGIAADLHEGGAATSGEAVLGTWGYMAPEQVEGAAASASFDVYALGVLLFETITGSAVPPHGWTVETLPRVETLRRGVPRALAQLVRSCMELEPSRRPGTAAEVVAELGRIVRGLEVEAAAAAGGRRGGSRGSSEEVLVRTGGTEVVRHASVSQVAVVAETPARTGGTELMTYDEVLSRSGLSGTLAAEVREGARQGLARRMELEREKARAREQARGWMIGLGVVGVIAAGVVWVGVGKVEVEGAGQVQGATEMDVAPEVEEAPEVDVARLESKIERAARPEGESESREGSEDDGGRLDVPRDMGSREEAPAPGEPRGPLPNDAGSSQPMPAPEEPVKDAEAEHAPGEAGGTRPSVSKPQPRPDEETCKTLRAEAVMARQMRTWRRALKLTGTRSCWGTKEQKLERLRLRVEAFAELGEFRKCVAEGGKAADGEIAARVSFCRKKLG